MDQESPVHTSDTPQISETSDRVPTEPPQVPWWMKVPYTLWVLVLIPVWVVELGWANFLWYSDVALFGIALAMWFRLRLVASVMLVGTLVLELAWNVGFFARLLFGFDAMEVVEYMFDPEKPLYVRFLSLFHVFLLPVMVWVVYRFGYDRRAFAGMTVVNCVLLPMTHLLSDRESNINFVYGFGDPPEAPVAEPWWVLAMMIALPLVVFWPTHRLLLWWPGESPRH